MSDQLLAATKEMVTAPIKFRGLHAYCTGYTGSRRGSVYVSLIGRVTAVTGIWAAFMDDVELPVPGSRHLRKRPKLDGAKYHTLRVRLPESDWLHLVLLHTQGTMQNLPGHPFFILSATPDPPLDAFWIQWGNAVALPALREWAPQLWTRGEGRKLINRVPAMGTHTWWVSADETKWSELLQNSLKAGIPS
jgi:hypothetical protein